MKKLMAVIMAVLVMVSLVTVAVSAEAYSLGDVNMSGGEPDANDLISLRKILLGAEESTLMADVTENGEVNILDLVHLKKMLANPNSGIQISGESYGRYTEIPDNWN